MEEKPKKNLYEIITDANEIVKSLIENGGELTLELEQLSKMSEIQLIGKIDAYGYVWDRLDIEESYWKTKAAEFSRISKSCGKARENLKNSMAFTMKSMGEPDLLGHDFRFKQGETPGKLEIYDPTLIPEEFLIKTVSFDPNKAQIKQSIVDGGKVPGCQIVKTPTVRKYAGNKELNNARKS